MFRHSFFGFGEVYARQETITPMAVVPVKKVGFSSPYLIKAAAKSIKS